ncbi:hypothetical protein EDC35_109160 [Thiobaca trueperi]|uniref:Uncharacterized protein n=2 Tax=Thiobaca trueperi TaxID=127458 RepID=A0A4R3MSB4_9GAMM|nr:hypothetical protein EDC35_109160 [Thiobaca trueperi]
MIDPTGRAIYGDIATNLDIRNQLQADINLGLDVFVEKHIPTIIEYYTSECPIEEEYAIEIAAAVWLHLHPDYERPLPKTREDRKALQALIQNELKTDANAFWQL